MTSYAYIVKEKNAQCTHMRMTRLHSQESRCSICQRDGSTVFIYQCTQDDEIKLQDLADHGELEIKHLFESLWDSFIGPFHSNTKDSCLVAKAENPLKHGPFSLHGKKLFSSNGTTDKEHGNNTRDNIIENPKLYIPSSNENKCQVKYCRNCFPCLEQRSFLELDSIVSRKIPLTPLLAHPEYERPVAPAKTVRNLGLRSNSNLNNLTLRQEVKAAEDCHLISLCSKAKHLNFDFALNKSSHLKSSLHNSPISTRSTPRLYFGPNKRRFHRISNKPFAHTTAPSSLLACNMCKDVNL